MIDDALRERWGAEAEACRRSLREFVPQAWAIASPYPFVDNWHIGTVCEHLQAVTDGEIRKLIINIPPRSTKSMTTSVIWPAWEWLTSPETAWLYASHTDRLSTRFATDSRRLMRSAGVRGDDVRDGLWLRHVGYRGLLALLGREWEFVDDQNLKTRYENSEGGYRVASSVGATPTGDGGDRLVIDDPSKAAKILTEAECKAVNDWYDGAWSTRLNDPVRAGQVLIMQRLAENDLTGHLLERGGWHHLCLPAEYEAKHPFVCPATVTIAGRELPGDPRTEEGESLDRVRLDDAHRADMARNLGSMAFAGQFQQRPAPAEGGMFKRAWWKRWRRATLPPAWERLIQSWDMAFKATDGSSYVVGQVWGVNGADRYLLGQIRARMEFTETCNAVVAMTAWQPDAWAKLVEDKANGPAVMNSLGRRITGLIPIEPDGSKEARAAAVTPIVEAGNVFLPEDDLIPCPPGYEPTRVEDFVEEHATFPAAARNDQVDTTSQALNWLEGDGGHTRVQIIAFKTYHHAEPVTHDGDLTLVGEHYVDLDRPQRSTPRRRGWH